MTAVSNSATTDPPAQAPSDGDRWIGIEEARRILETSRHRVLTRIAAREIIADRVAKRVVVLRDSVEQAKARDDAAKQATR